MVSKAFYVAMTRHVKDVHLYYKRTEFHNFDKLLRSASKYDVKRSLIDYEN